MLNKDDSQDGTIQNKVWVRLKLTDAKFTL